MIDNHVNICYTLKATSTKGDCFDTKRSFENNRRHSRVVEAYKPDAEQYDRGGMFPSQHFVRRLAQQTCVRLNDEVDDSTERAGKGTSDRLRSEQAVTAHLREACVETRHQLGGIFSRLECRPLYAGQRGFCRRNLLWRRSRDGAVR